MISEKNKIKIIIPIKILLAMNQNIQNAGVPLRGLPAELKNELFAALPFENAFNLLARMPNGILARNVRRMLKSIKIAIENNKWNEAECQPCLAFSDDSLAVTHNGPINQPRMSNVYAISPIALFNFTAKKPYIALYFEVKILKMKYSIRFGLVGIKFRLKRDDLEKYNSIEFVTKKGIWINAKWVDLNNEGGAFNVDDVIGCGLIHSPGAIPSLQCFVVCNGELLGKVNVSTKLLGMKFFPTASLVLAGDSIRANFGKEEWLYDPRQAMH